MSIPETVSLAMSQQQKLALEEILGTRILTVTHNTAFLVTEKLGQKEAQMVIKAVAKADAANSREVEV